MSKVSPFCFHSSVCCKVRLWLMDMTFTINCSFQSTKTQFLDPYIFVHLQNELWCDETEHCNLQGHSSFTPVYIYIHMMTFWSAYCKKLTPTPSMNLRLFIILNGGSRTCPVLNWMILIAAHQHLPSSGNWGYKTTLQC